MQRLFFSMVLLFNLHAGDLLSPNEHLGSTGKHLFHFVQVTDLHITHFADADRMEQFEQFCNEIIKKLIKPPVTIVSGDLVDSASVIGAKDDRFLATKQYEEEWRTYRDILARTNVTNHTKWLDMKGNHDTFMDEDPDALKSFSRIYSHQGHAHSGSYGYTHNTTDGDIYSFVSVDMCPRPGLGRPFNFYGLMDKKELRIVEKLSARTKNSTATIFFGHYPLSFTYSPGLPALMNHALVYLNGHLHSGVTKYLYTRHHNGLLELELGDWKRHRRFRLLTIDSGLLSLEDFRFNQPIYAVISNPKPAKFQTPREPLARISQSTHIRVVIFAYAPVVEVNISIDGRPIGSARQAVDHPNLFVLPWNATFYNDGKLHEISVQIKDSENNSKAITRDFSLSFVTVGGWHRSDFILRVHQPTFAFTILILSLSTYILILSIFRYQARRKSSHFNGRCALWNRFRLRMTLLCSVDLIYYSLTGFAVYHFIGPWYIGYLTTNQFGATFLWGILIQGSYLPPDTQILIGTFQLFFIVFPFTHSLSSLCFYRYKELQSSANLIKFRFNRCLRIYTVYILFLYVLALLILWSYSMTASYHLGWILSPFGIPLILSMIFLYIKTHRLTFDEFRLLTSTKCSEIINWNHSKTVSQLEEQQTALVDIKSQ